LNLNVVVTFVEKLMESASASSYLIHPGLRIYASVFDSKGFAWKEFLFGETVESLVAGCGMQKPHAKYIYRTIIMPMMHTAASAQLELTRDAAMIQCGIGGAKDAEEEQIDEQQDFVPIVSYIKHPGLRVYVPILNRMGFGWKEFLYEETVESLVAECGMLEGHAQYLYRTVILPMRETTLPAVGSTLPLDDDVDTRGVSDEEPWPHAAEAERATASQLERNGGARTLRTSPQDKGTVRTFLQHSRGIVGDSGTAWKCEHLDGSSPCGACSTRTAAHCVKRWRLCTRGTAKLVGTHICLGTFSEELTAARAYEAYSIAQKLSN
jgi:hypothetical protein